MSAKDGYTYSNGTLRNKLGITDAERLRRAEADLTANRIDSLNKGHGPRGNLDSTHLKAIHGHIFGAVYEWAGKTRAERTTIDGQTFTPSPILERKDTGDQFVMSPLVDRYLNQHMTALRNENHLRGLSREDFAHRAADFFAGLNSIHPFREGNGRTQRAFMREVARQAGHALSFAAVSQERMAHASREAHRGDPEPMRRLFNEITDRARSGALERATGFLESQGFDWNSRYVATTTPGQSYAGTFVSRGGQEFMMHDGRNSILIGQIRDLPHQPASGERVEFTAQAPWRERTPRSAQQPQQAQEAATRQAGPNESAIKERNARERGQDRER